NVDDKYTVCDVPGYGFANRSEKELIEFGDMMENYFSSREALRLCALILDIRHKPTKDDLEMIEYLKEMNIPFMIVLNKSDKVSGNERVKNIKLISELTGIETDKLVYVSTLKKTNIDILKERIENYL
ncbi:MAG: GTP-binding protein, partial [Erysipelotrichaceae bacterium]